VASQPYSTVCCGAQTLARSRRRDRRSDAPRCPKRGGGRQDGAARAVTWGHLPPRPTCGKRGPSRLGDPVPTARRENRFAFLKSAAERERLGWTVKRNMQTARSEPSWSTTTLGFQERGGGGRRVLTPGTTTPPASLGTGWPRGIWVTRIVSLSQRAGASYPAGRARPQVQVSALREFASVQIIKRCATRKNWSPGLKMGSAPYVAANRCEGARWSGGPER
jgi:hypothetical protein